MNALLDTHIFLWAITADDRLSETHRKLFQDGSTKLWLSVASIWEILIKVGLGKLPLPIPASAYVFKQLEKNRIRLLPIRAAHLTELERLLPFHRDPFDRMLVAQARAEAMTILSRDGAIRAYGVPVL